MKDDIVIEAYKQIIKAQETTIDSLLAVIQSQEQVICQINSPPTTITGGSYPSNVPPNTWYSTGSNPLQPKRKDK